MKTLKLMLPILLSTCLFLAGCSDTPSAVSEQKSSDFETEIAVITKANTDRQNFTVPFPPNPNEDFVPVPAPCLELSEPLQMSGTWHGWMQRVITPTGRVHVTERISYRDIVLRQGDLIWHAGHGASETIIRNVPLTAADQGEAAFNIIHQFNARFISQTDAPDLRVSHSVRQLLGPDGELRKNELVPFSAECIGK